MKVGMGMTFRRLKLILLLATTVYISIFILLDLKELYKSDFEIQEKETQKSINTGINKLSGNSHSKKRTFTSSARGSPVAWHDSSIERPESPGERRELPLERWDSLVERRESPIERRDSPIERRESSVERHEPPVELHESPVDRRQKLSIAHPDLHKLGYVGNESSSEHKRRNVLLIMADDLRAQLGCYTRRQAHTDQSLYTPNLDRLAGDSLLLTSAYAQFSLCGPSRTSLLTSRRPDSTLVYKNHDYFRRVKVNKYVTTLPEYFKNSGYTTLGLGKVFHKDDKQSWSAPIYWPPNKLLQEDIKADWKMVPGEEHERDPLEDELVKNKAIEILRGLATEAHQNKHASPFFLAVGFAKPHLPFVCPEKFYKMYALETGRQYLEDMSWQTPAIKPGDNMYTPGNGSILPDHYLRVLRRAYFACVSYVDQLIGDLIAALDALGLARSTVVAFTSDHGLHLGENNKWGKPSVHDIGVHVPLMIRIPGTTDGGITSPAVVELVDVFPTLAEAAGLDDVPPCSSHYPIATCTEGKSLMRLVNNPMRSIRLAAMSQINYESGVVVYSVRSHKYRLTEAVKFLPPQKIKHGEVPYIWNPGSFNTSELYNLSEDPAGKNNIAGRRDMQDARKRLHTVLVKHLDNVYASEINHA